MTQSQQGDTFQPGDVLNNTYRIEAVLGRGGTSEVYRARSEISGREVALKVLKSEMAGNADYLVLMTREEEIREVRHAAVVRYSENHRTQDGHIYLVMDFVDGPGLDQKLKSGGMSADDLMVVGRRVAEGLAAVHQHNIVHRDLSPDNIILRNDDPSEAVIIDFGIAKDTNPGAATIVGNEFAGKYAYAAPEQLSGNSDARSDIYSLGALLLATFRAAAPNVGRNPMEVIENKGKALDTEGVPEPLKSLIDRMAHPDPAQRFQTAQEVVTAFDPDPLASLTPEATVVTAPPSQPPKPKAKDAPAKKKSGLLVPLLLVLLLGGGGAGVYFSGLWQSLLGPSLPLADPYTLIAEREAGGAPRVTGSAPSEAAQAVLSGPVTELGGQADLALARGDIGESWPQDVADLMNMISPLEEWRLSVSGNAARVTGLTVDRDLRARLQNALSTHPMVNGVEIALGPRLLSTTAVTDLMARFADCGPLELAATPVDGFAMGEAVTVTGKVGSEQTRERLQAEIAALAGDRPVRVETEVLNPELCVIDAQLPFAPSGGFDIVFGYGDRPDLNPTGAYKVGENPTIDVVIPAEQVRGFLWVSIMDVSGNVYHLLPNINRPDNALVSLRDGADGPVTVRVAYSIGEALADNARLSFLVDENFGKSKIVVIHSSAPLFGEMRPTTESLASYTAALSARLDDGATTIYGLDSRIIDSGK